MIENPPHQIPAEKRDMRTARPAAMPSVFAPRTPRLKTIPLSPTAACANVVRYGDSNAPATVVLKAEFAQSYMAQPKISCLSLIAAGALACFTAVIVSQVGFLAKGER